jgi:hypothetical protein
MNPIYFALYVAETILLIILIANASELLSARLRICESATLKRCISQNEGNAYIIQFAYIY